MVALASSHGTESDSPSPQDLCCRTPLLSCTYAWRWAVGSTCGICTVADTGDRNGCACLQGVICFESTMAAGEAAGIVQNGRPVLCKPSAVVSRPWLQGICPSCWLPGYPALLLLTSSLPGRLMLVNG